MKENNKKSKMVKVDLENCHAQIDELCKQNVKLCEDIKTLEEIVGYDKSKKDICSRESDDESDEECEEDVMVVKTIQKKIDKEKSRKDFKCNECDFEVHTMGLLRRHQRVDHSRRIENISRDETIRCRKCDFRCLNKNVLLNHVRENHQNKECKYWAKGHCKKGSDCQYYHTINRSRAACRFFLRGSCYFGNNCKFSHDIISRAEQWCKFGNNCRSWPNCRFQHESGQQQFGVQMNNSNSKPFLVQGWPQLNSFQQFPPLQPSQNLPFRW